LRAEFELESKLKVILRWESQSRGKGTPTDELKRDRLVWHLVTMGHIEANSIVLSAGCGTGYFELKVKKFTDNLFCLDVSREMIAICRMRGFRNLIRGSALHLPLRGDVFDCVYALSITSVGSDTATDHTRLRTVQEMRRVSKNGGMILTGHPTTVWKQIRSLLEHGNPNIEKFRVSPEEVAAAYKQSGLKALKSIVLPPIPYPALRKLKYQRVDRMASRLLLSRIGPYLLMSGVK